MKRIIFCIAAVVCLLELKAQSYFDDLAKVRQAYKAAPVQTTIRYALFSAHSGGENIQQSEAEYATWREQLYYRRNDVELLTNERYNISINKLQKRLIINRANLDYSRELLKKYEAFDWKTLAEKNAVITLSGTTDSVRTWRIKYNRPLKGMSQIDISIDLHNYLLRKVVIYYDKTFFELYGKAPDKVSETNKPLLVITYDNRTLAESELAIFTTDRFFEMSKKGKATGVGAYKNFSISNFYNEK